MSDGVVLSLRVGPGVALPAPASMISALQRAQVTEAAEGKSGFQLTFGMARGSELESRLAAGFFEPLLARVQIIVTVRGQPHVLMDGLVTRLEAAAGAKAGESTLTITGEDLSVAMDLVGLTGLMPYPAMPYFARALAILARYAWLGIIPKVIPSPLTEIPNPLERIDTQRGTDLQYLKRLANEVGYVFYMEPGPAPGVNVAYWGPEIRYGETQPALSADMDGAANVESLSFSFDGLSGAIYTITVYEKTTKVPLTIPVPDVGLLRPPLALVRPIPTRLESLAEQTSRMSPLQAAAIGLAKAARASDAVSGSGSLDVTRYGHVLRARKLVGVRGAGQAFDGRYYVKSVTHELQPGAYRQSFQLAREGLVPLEQRVRV
jgi:hypothetical protein